MSKDDAYAQAGVDIRKADDLTGAYSGLARGTKIPGSLGAIGGFAGLFDIKRLNFRDPLLVSGADGVGTKLLLAHQRGRIGHIGQDLVAMCVNDILCCGARPLFFLDYFACGSLDAEQAKTVVGSIAAACQIAGCELLGGETAEMPGLYRNGEFDLAGFCVGAVERDLVLGPDRVRKGDIVLALASSGPHSNGFSLIRKLLDDGHRPPADVDDHLLEPTAIYCDALLPLAGTGKINALAHITGGGLQDNLARVLPDGLSAALELNWELPAVFDWIKSAAGLDIPELLRIFNGGVGMTAVVAPEDSDSVSASLAERGVRSWPIGAIVPRGGDAVIIQR